MLLRKGLFYPLATRKDFIANLPAAEHDGLMPILQCEIGRKRVGTIEVCLLARGVLPAHAVPLFHSLLGKLLPRQRTMPVGR